jgi:hypothetical protein
MHAFLKEAKYKEALYASRADVSQYTIWHKSHTEPAIRGGMPKEGSILEIDIRALADCVDRLMFCHIKADMMDEFPAVLERLRSNISDPDWQRKIIYFHALHALWPEWDRKAGRRELKKLGSVADEKDEQILQLYLDLFGDDLAFSKKQDLIELCGINRSAFAAPTESSANIPSACVSSARIYAHRAAWKYSAINSPPWVRPTSARSRHNSRYARCRGAGVAAGASSRSSAARHSVDDRCPCDAADTKVLRKAALA